MVSPGSAGSASSSFGSEQPHSSSEHAAELVALQREYDEWSTSAAATRERIYNQLVSSIDMLTLHKEDVENQLDGLKKYCKEKEEALAPLLDEGAVELA